MSNAKRIVTIIFLSATLFSTIYLSVAFLSSAAEHNTQQNDPNINPKYTVKEYEGKIGVFTFGNKSPDRILDGILVRDLPTYDRELLKNGIDAKSDAELSSILEDYDS